MMSQCCGTGSQAVATTIVKARVAVVLGLICKLGGIQMVANGVWRQFTAFTLIELVTVIAILAIIAVAVGGPTLVYLDSMRAHAAASRLSSDVRYVQRTALNSGLRTWMVFSTASNNYQLYIEDRDNPGEASRLAMMHPFDQTSNAVQFGAGAFTSVSITSVDVNSTSELEFDSFGVPYDGDGAALTGDAVITLSSGVTITVHPAGGFVERSG